MKLADAFLYLCHGALNPAAPARRMLTSAPGSGRLYSLPPRTRIASSASSPTFQPFLSSTGTCKRTRTYRRRYAPCCSGVVAGLSLRCETSFDVEAWSNQHFLTHNSHTHCCAALQVTVKSLCIAGKPGTLTMYGQPGSSMSAICAY